MTDVISRTGQGQSRLTAEWEARQLALNSIRRRMLDKGKLVKGEQIKANDPYTYARVFIAASLAGINSYLNSNFYPQLSEFNIMDIAYLPLADKVYYWTGTEWALFGGGGMHIVANYAALLALTVETGKLGFTADFRQAYMYNSVTWGAVGPFRQENAPASMGERIGDFWVQTSTGRVHYKHTSEGWTVLPHVSSNKLYYHNGTSNLLVSHFG